MSEVFPLDLPWIRGRYEERFQATGKLSRPAETQDSTGEPLEAETVWDDVVAIPCGFEAKGGAFRSKRDGTLVETDGRVRFAAGTDVRAGDEFLLVSTFGTDLDTPVEFEVVSTPAIGPAGVLADVKKLEP